MWELLRERIGQDKKVRKMVRRPSLDVIFGWICVGIVWEFHPKYAKIKGYHPKYAKFKINSFK